MEQQPIRHRAFVASSQDAYFGPFSAHETRRNASFQLEKSLVYQDLKGSLGRLDEHGRFFGTGNLPHERRNCVEIYYNCEASRPCSKDVNPPASSLQSKDSRREGVKGTPMSLRILKRKHSRNKEIEYHKRPVVGRENGSTFTRTAGDSCGDAFSSLVLMIKTLLEHALLFFNDVQQAVSMAHMDLQESFLWLFQQVFSSTPKLMLLVLILLADFTLHSMGKYVALPVMPLGEPPTSSIMSSVQGGAMDILKAVEDLSLVNDDCIQIQDFERPSWPTAENGSEGNGGGRILKIGCQTDGYSWPGMGSAISQGSAMYSEDDTCGGSLSMLEWDMAATLAQCRDCTSSSDAESNSASEDRLPSAVTSKIASEVLDQETKTMFVAPVNVEVESDDYVCYDRTDLNYQHAISTDPDNPLLLSNYAQFLYLVRHDHLRAEKMFRRATTAADAVVDGEVMGRFASFLWVAKGDLVGADKAYSAALDADPTNSFHAACYAHFLWDSGEQHQTKCDALARA